MKRIPLHPPSTQYLEAHGDVFATNFIAALPHNVQVSKSLSGTKLRTMRTSPNKLL